MQRCSKERRFRGRKAGTLFGEPIIDPLGHLSAHYPFPARLNDHYVAKLKTSNHWDIIFQGGGSIRGRGSVHRCLRHLGGTRQAFRQFVAGKDFGAWFLWSRHDPRTRGGHSGTYPCCDCGNHETNQGPFCGSQGTYQRNAGRRNGRSSSGGTGERSLLFYSEQNARRRSLAVRRAKACAMPPRVACSTSRTRAVKQLPNCI